MVAKSFREVSRDTGITTPTVKARFTRLINDGFRKSVSPILDFNIIEKEDILKPELENEQDTFSNLAFAESILF
jgi:DNA-binding Lrp family transcriptional regulator